MLWKFDYKKTLAMIPILSNFSRCLTHAHALTLIICLFSREPDEKFRPLNIFHDFFVEF